MEGALRRAEKGRVQGHCASAGLGMNPLCLWGFRGPQARTTAGQILNWSQGARSVVPDCTGGVTTSHLDGPRPHTPEPH